MGLERFAVKIEVSTGETLTDGSDTLKSDFTATGTTKYAVTGSGAGVVTKKWSDLRTIVSAGNDDIDLSGSLVNSIGAAFVLTNLKTAYIKFVSGTGTLTIGGATAPVLGLTGILNVGERYCFDAGPTGAGKTVTATTADILRLTSSAANAVYEICLGGI